MDFIVQFVQSRAAKVIAAFFVLALVFAGTLYLLLPSGSKFTVQTGPGSSETTSPATEASPIARSPSPAPPQPAEITSTSALERSQIIVVIQLAGASADEYSRITDTARNLGYPVRSAPPTSEPVDRSILKFRPGKRSAAEQVAKDLRPNAQLVEEPISGADIWLMLGRS